MVQTRACEWKYRFRTVSRKEIDKSHVEEVAGDTLFMVVGKEECYFNHYLIAKDLDEYGDLEEFGAWSVLGWIITKRGIGDMKRRAEEEAEEQARQKEEFSECVLI